MIGDYNVTIDNTKCLKFYSLFHELFLVYSDLFYTNSSHYRLLAREGLNAEQLARDLKSFELKVELIIPAESYL